MTDKAKIIFACIIIGMFLIQAVVSYYIYMRNSKKYKMRKKGVFFQPAKYTPEIQVPEKSSPQYYIYGNINHLGFNIEKERKSAVDIISVVKLLDSIDPFEGPFDLFVESIDDNRLVVFECSDPNMLIVNIKGTDQLTYCGKLVYPSDMSKFTIDYFNNMEVIKGFGLTQLAG